MWSVDEPSATPTVLTGHERFKGVSAYACLPGCLVWRRSVGVRRSACAGRPALAIQVGTTQVDGVLAVTSAAGTLVSAGRDGRIIVWSVEQACSTPLPARPPALH